MRIPVIMLLHPVGIGSTRTMNVASAKMWLRVLVDILPDVSISAPWLPYAEVNVDRDRGLRDAFATIERHDGAVATGGEFSRGMVEEWELFGKLKLPRIDLTPKSFPGVLTTQDSYLATRQPAFHKSVLDAFSILEARKAA